MRRLIVCVLACASAVGAGWGQAFEVASVRLNKSGARGGTMEFPPGHERFVMRNTSLGALILVAYDITVRQLAGTEKLISEPYDIAAKAERPATRDEMREMLLVGRKGRALQKTSDEPHEQRAVRGGVLPGVCQSFVQRLILSLPWPRKAHSSKKILDRIAQQHATAYKSDKTCETSAGTYGFIARSVFALHGVYPSVGSSLRIGGTRGDRRRLNLLTAGGTPIAENSNTRRPTSDPPAPLAGRTGSR